LRKDLCPPPIKADSGICQARVLIDLYYAHRLERGRPVEEIVDTLAGLFKAGKVRAIGLSEVSAETFRSAASVHPIAAASERYPEEEMKGLNA
jgi:hypothetical protein